MLDYKSFDLYVSWCRRRGSWKWIHHRNRNLQSLIDPEKCPNLTISKFLALFRLWAGKVLVQMVRLVKHPENTMMMCPSQTFAAAWYWNLCISLCLWWLFLVPIPLHHLDLSLTTIVHPRHLAIKPLHHYIICLLLHLFISLQLLAHPVVFLLLLLMVCLDFLHRPNTFILIHRSPLENGVPKRTAIDATWRDNNVGFYGISGCNS